MVVCPCSDLVGDPVGKSTASPFRLIPKAAIGTLPRKSLNQPVDFTQFNAAFGEPCGVLITLSYFKSSTYALGCHGFWNACDPLLKFGLEWVSERGEITVPSGNPN